MNAEGIVLVAALVLVPLLVILEGKRQERKYGKPSGRGGMARAGLLELQRHLQPDRKVEVMLDESRAAEKGEEGAGAPPEAGGGPDDPASPPADAQRRE